MQLLNTLETSGDATSVLSSAEQLISEFGADNVGGAYQNLTLAKFLGKRVAITAWTTQAAAAASANTSRHGSSSSTRLTG